MKYICVQNEDGGFEIITFPKSIHHDVMSEAVQRMKNQTHGNWNRTLRKTISAGFVNINNECFGKSESLGLESKKEDTEILHKQFCY